MLFDTLHYIAYLAISLQLLRVDLFSLNGLQLCRCAAVVVRDMERMMCMQWDEITGGLCMYALQLRLSHQACTIG